MRKAIELEHTFDFQDWKIAYNLLSPSDQSNQTAVQRTVVFVHGTPWSSQVFAPFADALLARGSHRVLLYDLAGYGDSQDTEANVNEASLDTSVGSQAKLLCELLKHLHLEGSELDVFAHDIAGAIALRAHLIHGCSFSSLLLLDTNAVLPWGDGFYKLVRSEPDTFRKLPPSIFEAVVRAAVRSACFEPKKLDTGWEDTLAGPWISDAGESSSKGQQSFVRQIAQANDADIAEMLDQNLYEKVACPVKIIWGQEDQWIPYEKMEKLASLLKHCLKEFVVIPEAGHLVMIDQPVRVTSEMLSWLGR
jgi:pimeloyl-ACP methyl ester carboxylesterase